MWHDKWYSAIVLVISLYLSGYHYHPWAVKREVRLVISYSVCMCTCVHIYVCTCVCVCVCVYVCVCSFVYTLC